MSGEYPKWVQRDAHIGPVLCVNEKQERELLNSWETEQAEKAEAEAKVAAGQAAEAEEAAKVALKQGGKGK
ncbi:hypothetical protein [Bacteriophage sp.]|nr:hypothetical protein [Caudoviricetes sp.]UOF80013.1 hypothetical protein [Bacteriophage sp.]